jgi:isopentenyl diphosphate isomerase/L-lactate dehydrogenase-like FMN-dependent dehydrogenase
MTLSEIYKTGKENLLSKDIGFVVGAVETGWVWYNNRAVFDYWAFRQKAVNAPAAADATTELLNVKLSAPVIMSAMTMPIPAICEDGLLQLANGLKAAGSLMWTGTPIPKDLGALLETGVPLMVSVKPYADRDKLANEIRAAQKEGVTMISVEVDAGQGTKVRDKQMAKDCAPLSLDELKELRRIITGKMIAKGVLSDHDALLCVEAGVDAITASNHGAHTIDFLPHPLQVVDEIVSAVAGRCPIIMDGGFRRGSDIVKGLALGADAIGLGRPILYALAAGGTQGVVDLFDNLKQEMSRIMVMLGAAGPDELAPDCLIEV